MKFYHALTILLVAYSPVAFSKSMDDFQSIEINFQKCNIKFNSIGDKQEFSKCLTTVYSKSDVLIKKIRSESNYTNSNAWERINLNLNQQNQFCRSDVSKSPIGYVDQELAFCDYSMYRGLIQEAILLKK